LPADPARVDLRHDGRDWPRALIDSFSEPLLPSAVLIPIVERESGLTVLLTERAANLTHHPGQISFPGGRMEAGDRDLVDTALRETREEVGIQPGQVGIAGFLSTLPTVTGYAVTPVVGLVHPGIELVLDEREVASAFEVPLNFLLDSNNQEHSSREYRGINIPVVAYQFASRRIWGATAAMIIGLQKHLRIK
jgi:8-oxo-dGTP pyrophosphatase MutT (NUDIX family)